MKHPSKIKVSSNNKHTHTHTPFFLTPIAKGNDSDATAEAVATCAGIAQYNSLQG